MSRPPQLGLPAADIEAYARFLLAIVADLAGSTGARADAMPPSASAGKVRRELLLRSANVERRVVNRMTQLVEAASVSVKRKVDKTAIATVKKKIGETEVYLVKSRDAWIKANTRLITRMAADMRADVARAVKVAGETGQRPETLRKILAERVEVAESRAKLIARDQLQKYQAQVNEATQRRVGATHYVWRHSGLTRNPRDEHVARNGRRFSWSSPPDDGHPGEAINCRCTAEPDLSSIFDD